VNNVLPTTTQTMTTLCDSSSSSTVVHTQLSPPPPKKKMKLLDLNLPPATKEDNEEECSPSLILSLRLDFINAHP
jgi:hypothetical protein